MSQPHPDTAEAARGCPYTGIGTRFDPFDGEPGLLLCEQREESVREEMDVGVRDP